MAGISSRTGGDGGSRRHDRMGTSTTVNPPVPAWRDAGPVVAAGLPAWAGRARGAAVVPHAAVARASRPTAAPARSGALLGRGRPST